MSETPKWYVVHTYSGYENKVATDIENAVENRKLHDLIGGYLDGFIGVVEEIDTDRNMVKVVVSMFGRETPVELQLDQVETIE